MAAVLPGDPSSSTATRAAPFVVGVDHRTCPAELRERLFLADDALPSFLAELRGDGLMQAFVVSTCDRVEVAGMHADPATASRIVAERLTTLGGFGDGGLATYLTLRQGREAVEHIFAVAASLDSVMVGEPQVLGQVRAAYRQAADAGLVGTELDRLMQAALAAAKRVRTETGLGVRAVSVATAALQIAREVHGALDRRAALFIGAGEMGELLADKLRDAGMSRFLVADSLAPRARATAARLQAHVMPLDGLDAALTEADIVVCALGRGHYVVDSALMRAALRRRRQRPVFLVDAAVPCDVAPEVNEIDEVFLYNLDDLERVAHEGRGHRDQEADRARLILRESIDAYERAVAAREAVPIVAALRAHFETARSRLLAEQPGLPAEEATRLLVNRLLHEPSTALRALAASGAPLVAQEEMLMRLFGLAAPDQERPQDCPTEEKPS